MQHTFLQNQSSVRIIARPKLSGFGEHWGVQLPNNMVAHRTTEGEKMASLSEFAQNLPVREVRKAPPERHQQIVWRAITSTQNPGQYRLLDRNCETYATWLMGETPHSPQVLGVTLLALLFAFLRLD